MARPGSGLQRQQVVVPKPMISSPSPLRGLRKRNQRILVVATVRTVVAAVATVAMVDDPGRHTQQLPLDQTIVGFESSD
jgi:hypothetical protein